MIDKIKCPETKMQSKCNLILAAKWTITCPAFLRLGRVTSSLKLVDLRASMVHSMQRFMLNYRPVRSADHSILGQHSGLSCC